MLNNKNLRNDVDTIINKLILDINPYDSTSKCLANLKLNDGKNILICIGKAAWQMGKAVSDNIHIDTGAIITKYGYSNGCIDNLVVFEAGHPIVDENSIKASEYVLSITENLEKNDNVIFCVSGGGSALFEKPQIPLNKLQKINDELIKSGASINEINTIRKRLSNVKAGRFAIHCNCHINAIILSDVVGDDLSSIASGPVFADTSTCKEANDIVNKYNIEIDDEIKQLLNNETPKQINNVSSYIVSSVKQLCLKTADICKELGYQTEIIQDDCTDSVEMIANEFEQLSKQIKPNFAYIIGGESVVKVNGKGIGGRNSHLALLCSKFINDEDMCMFAFGSDGSDGPTDTAGGYVDINTKKLINVDEYLNNFDSYNALQKIGGLIKTGPTGSNVNDVYVLMKK